MSVKILSMIIGNVHSIYGMMLLFGATPAVFAELLAVKAAGAEK